MACEKACLCRKKNLHSVLTETGHKTVLKFLLLNVSKSFVRFTDTLPTTADIYVHLAIYVLVNVYIYFLCVCMCTGHLYLECSEWSVSR